MSEQGLSWLVRRLIAAGVGAISAGLVGLVIVASLGGSLWLGAAWGAAIGAILGFVFGLSGLFGVLEMLMHTPT